jgi:enoyl-CoA hydratase
MSDYGIRLERADSLAIVTLDRPQRSNTFDESMWSALGKTAIKLERNLPRAVIVTGAGDKAFSAGFDVNPDNPQVTRLMEALQQGNRKPVEQLLDTIRRSIDRLVALPVPIIAAVNGKAFGGGAELAVRCDLRVMDPGAVICFSEVRLGLMPDWGGTAALCRLLGSAKATDLILTAREIEAMEALSLGLVNRLSAPGNCLEEAIELARSITRNGPKAVASALAVIRSSRDLTLL